METLDEMLAIYAAALRRHQHHLEDGCDRRAWHERSRFLIERAVWSANSSGEPIRGGLPWPLDPSRIPWRPQ